MEEQTLLHIWNREQKGTRSSYYMEQGIGSPQDMECRAVRNRVISSTE
jgi:hypothetical protein